MRIGFAALLAVLLFGAGCGRTLQTGGLSIASELARHVPPDTRILAGIQVTRLENAPFFQQNETQFGMGQIDAIAERLGVNLHRDLTAALACWSNPQPLILIRGRFQPAQIERGLIALGGRNSAYRKMQMVTFGDYAACVRADLIATGSVQQVRAAVDRDRAGQGGVPEEINQRLHELRQQDQVWIVSRGGLPLIEMAKRTDIASALSNIAGYINGTSAGLTVDTGLHLRAAISCISYAGVQRVRDGLRAGIAFARFSTKDRELQNLLETIRIAENGREVMLQADLSPEQSAALLKYLPPASALPH